MAPGGESPDADAVGIDAVFGGVGAEEAHRAASVVDLDGIAVGLDAVIENEGGHALSVEPGGDLEAFVADRDVLVTSAGNDEDSGAGGACLRQERIHAGLVRFSGAERARCSAGPKVDGG